MLYKASSNGVHHVIYLTQGYFKFKKTHNFIAIFCKSLKTWSLPSVSLVNVVSETRRLHSSPSPWWHKFFIIWIVIGGVSHWLIRPNPKCRKTKTMFSLAQTFNRAYNNLIFYNLFSSPYFFYNKINENDFLLQFIMLQF